jgi:hypothetical protein
LKKYKALLKDFCTSDEESKVFIEVAEIYCTQKLKNSFHLIMQCLYTLDLIKDKFVLEWGETAKKCKERHEKGEKNEDESSDGSDIDDIL